MTLRIERHGGAGGHGDTSGPVVEVVLDRPEALNALSTAFGAQLRDALLELAADRGVRAVVLSSSQSRAFCVGADLKERNTFTDQDLLAQRLVFRSLSSAFLAVPVPLVAAVAGHALGGGFELALLCDLIVAEQTASFALPEVSVGVVPGLGGTQLLSRRIGLGRAGDLIYTTRRLSGVQAYDLGAVDRLVEEGAARRVALDVAATIAGNSPVGVRNAKRALRRGFALDLEAGLDVEDSAWRATAFSADRAEGVRAFVEKRRPDWPGLG